uniref:Uncharacterized protein n=1 Tax=Arundo donax TaxID=35708 RepID=A0A0A9GRJ5_ARUDO
MSKPIIHLARICNFALQTYESTEQRDRNTMMTKTTNLGLVEGLD